MSSQPPATTLRVIAWLYLILGGNGLVVGSALLASIALSGSPSAPAALGWVGFPFLFVAVPWLLPMFFGGWGVLRGRFWGRAPFAIASVLLIPAVPIGTLLGGLGLRALLRSPSPPPGAPWKLPSLGPVAGLLPAMALVGSGFVVLLWAGFIYHDDPVPPEIDTVIQPAAAIFAVTALWWLYRLFTGLPHALAGRGSHRRAQSDWQAERTRRIAELRADPVRSPYAARMEAGEHWTDEQIAYDLDPDAIGTCSHLAEIERAMRRQGFRVKLLYGHILTAHCTVDEPALHARFTLTAPAEFALIPNYERSHEDPPSAAFRCTEHGAMLYVVDPDRVTPETPRFPR